ncbi:hypothetical protein PCASD_08292 [Puccinia coronata f. sp. avenae]|uniref:Uncharacterized protein n=1 Tax=Puccinia coronata f. sp. avenae TaxID=200324 RepID=A0A2N5V124_9BASI|nr:hypothetical protein PCASD_08292 [Puccinia coronata f. sp. avenae]
MKAEFDLVHVQWVDDNLFVKLPQSKVQMKDVVQRSACHEVKTNEKKYSDFGKEQKHRQKKPIRWDCPTRHRTQFSNAMLDKPVQQVMDLLGELFSQKADDLLGELFAKQVNGLLVKELGEQANNLLAKS